MKQFRHYLLGHSFQLVTDHALLQWLSAQKMEVLLCCWALAMEEYSFDIVYCKGIINGNANALLRWPHSPPMQIAMTSVTHQLTDIQQAQQCDPALSWIHHALLHSQNKLVNIKIEQPSFQRYMQLRYQLSLKDDVICRIYYPSPTSDSVTVSLIPPSLQQQALYHAHNILSAGYQGYHKTLSRLKEEAYWPGMASDVQHYCEECNTCQKSKPSAPVRAPLVNIPIGNP